MFHRIQFLPLFCQFPPKGAHQNNVKNERELHKVIEEPETPTAEAMEIDLKCAEKVTDSDVESNADDKVKSPLNIIDLPSINFSSAHSQSGSYQKEQSFYGDVTRKPKPINPLHQNESSIYSPMPMFPYNSPKNPIGVMPFQPKGKSCRELLRIGFNFNRFSLRWRFPHNAAEPQNNWLHPNNAHNQIGNGSKVSFSQQHQQQHHLQLPIRTEFVDHFRRQGFNRERHTIRVASPRR
jgi:hypothetical protein